MSIPHDPTCYVCGVTLATWEIRYKLAERKRVPLTRQKCFECRTGHMPKRKDINEHKGS